MLLVWYVIVCMFVVYSIDELQYILYMDCVLVQLVYVVLGQFLYWFQFVEVGYCVCALVEIVAVVACFVYYEIWPFIIIDSMFMVMLNGE